MNDKALGLLAVMKREGFTEEALKMNMKKVWNFYRVSIAETLGKLFDNLFKGMEEHPENVGLVKPLFDTMTEQLDKFEKEDAENTETDKKSK